jgi:hypothetical protein
VGDHLGTASAVHLLLLFAQCGVSLVIVVVFLDVLTSLDTSSVSFCTVSTGLVYFWCVSGQLLVHFCQFWWFLVSFVVSFGVFGLVLVCFTQF